MVGENVPFHFAPGADMHLSQDMESMMMMQPQGQGYMGGGEHGMGDEEEGEEEEFDAGGMLARWNQHQQQQEAKGAAGGR